MQYYMRADVRKALMDFMRPAEGIGVRESAVYNRRFKSIQRYVAVGEHRIPIEISQRSLADLVRQGAYAFYGSYWRYERKAPETPIGRDLVWTVRAVRGGIHEAKETTSLILDGFAEMGVELWVKYDGKLGFDLVLPLEAIPQEVWTGNPSALDDLHQKLTVAAVSRVRERLPDATITWLNSGARIVRDSGESLLSELRIRRGLLLAPMSLNPSTGLVSLPLKPGDVAGFLPIDATRDFVRPAEWKIPQSPSYTLFRMVAGRQAAVLQF
jgi:hypothetical protein